MKSEIPSNNEILRWSQKDMEAYWMQCHHCDKRPFDTLSIMGGTYNQPDSERSFSLLVKGIAKRHAKDLNLLS